MSSEDIIIEKLLKDDEVFKNIYYEHRQLDEKVADLENKDELTRQEELEIKQLKKVKLALKDKMQQRINIFKNK
jgi:uncharacterized protein